MSANQNQAARAAASGKPAVKGAQWGARLLLDKTCEALRLGALPQSQTLGNALAIAASDQLDVERLSAQPAPLPESARRAVLQAMEKAKYPGVSWESVVEPMLAAVWREKRRPAAAPAAKAPGAKKPSAAKGAPAPGARAGKAKAPSSGAAKAGSNGQGKAAAPAAPVIVRKAAKLLNRPS